MEATISLRLPRDAASVPVIRQLLDATLRSLGVAPHIRDDLELLLTEACANVITHAAPSDDYTVSAAVHAERCVITVADTGGGFDPRAVVEVSPTAEHGRGLQIINALADEVYVTSEPERGVMVCMAKRLEFVPGALGHDLAVG